MSDPEHVAELERQLDFLAGVCAREAGEDTPELREYWLVQRGAASMKDAWRIAARERSVR